MEKYNEIYSRPATLSMVEENGKIWMALANRNGICEVDLNRHRARICKFFENESLAKEDLYDHVERLNNKLVFAPGFAKKIALYNLVNSSITYIPLRKLKHKGKEFQNEWKFGNAFQYQSDVYMLGYSYPAIIKLNVESMKIEYITEWLKEIDENNIESGDDYGYFSEGYAISGDSAFIPVGCMRAVLELNLITSQTKLRKLKVSMKCISGLSSTDGENIWLVGKGSKTNWVSCWNTQTDSIKEIQLMDIDENLFDPFYAPICMTSKLFLAPKFASHFYEIDLKTGNIQIIEQFEGILKDTVATLWPGGWKIISPRLQGEWIIFLTSNDLKWYQFNVLTNEVRDYFVYLEENNEERENYLNELYIDSAKVVIPEIKIPLRYFIKRISCSINSYNKKKEISLIGKKIWDLI